MTEIFTEDTGVIVKTVKVYTVDLITGITDIVTKSSSLNSAANEMPPVLPHHLVKIRGHEFCQIYLDAE